MFSGPPGSGWTCWWFLHIWGVREVYTYLEPVGVITFKHFPYTRTLMKDTTDYEAFKKILDLNDFVSLKTDTLDFLVKEKGFLKVDGKIGDMKYVFDVQVRHPLDKENPYDCKIGNFSLNKFFRTRKGAKGEKYESFSAMLVSIKKGLKSKLDAEAVSYKIIQFPF